MYYLTRVRETIRIPPNRFGQPIEDVILDVGILVHNERVKAAFKGVLDSGIDIPHNDEWFSEALEDRINGKHIEEYAKILSKKDAKSYKQRFSAILKRKGDPKKYVAEFEKIKGQIDKQVK